MAKVLFQKQPLTDTIKLDISYIHVYCLII